MSPLTAGELWARRELDALRRERFAARAVARFLDASRRRARDQRRARPELTRQARSWVAAGGGAWLVAAGVAGGAWRRRARGGLAWWAVTGLMLDWHLGMVETEDGRPRRLGAADACTLLRAWLVPIAAERPGPLVCAVALATDGLDGVLARAGEPTRLGRDMEAVVDSVFSAAALRGALRQGWLGRPAAAAEAARLVAGAVYAGAAYFATSVAPDRAVAGAARSTTPVRMAGLIGAGLGRRRSADVLVSLGAVLGIAGSLGRLRSPGG